MTGPRRVVRQLVLVTSVVGLLTGAVGLAVVRHLERSTLMETAGDAGLASAERAAGVIDGRIDALLAQLRLLATRDALLDRDGVGTELEVALRVTEQIDELVLYDDTGTAVAAAATDRVLRPRDLDEFAVPSDEASAAPVARIERDGEESLLELAVPVEFPPGTVTGYLVGRADLALVAGEITQPMSGGGRASLVSRDGRTVVDRDRDRVASEHLQPLGELPAQRPVAELVVEGERTLVSAAPLRTLAGSVVVEQASSRIVGPDRSGVGGPTGVLLVVVLAIVLAVIATARRLLRPLGPLADGVGRLAAGERGVRVEEEGAGEVAELAAGFNRMAVALEVRRRDLENAERNARLNEERLRLVVEGVEGHAIVLLDVLGDVRSWNAGAERVTGRDEDAMLGRRLTDLGATDEPLADPVLEATRTGSGRTEGWFVRPDGSRFWGELEVTALRREDGAPSGYAAILQDVTERRAARQALELALQREQQAAGELRRANELKDEFLAVAAHEMRTPLAAILGATKILAPGPFALDAAETEEVRQMIWRHAKDMHGIVERLMDFTQLQAGRVRIAPRPLLLASELRRIVAAMSHDLADHVVDVDAPDVEVDLDPGFLHHVTSNLLSNAAKFSPLGTRITVRGGVASGSVTIAVTDEGPGIAPEEQDQIFELFRQSTHADASARGTGVGLTIVRRYVELVGGEVGVDSELGRGATFTVQVPGPPGRGEGEPSSSDERGTSVR